MNQGVIEGVANAPEIRDLILGRLRSTRFTGLGDEPAASPAAPTRGWSPKHLAALREIAAAARGPES